MNYIKFGLSKEAKQKILEADEDNIQSIQDEIDIIIKQSIIKQIKEIEDELNKIMSRIMKLNPSPKSEDVKQYIGGIMTARDVVTLYKNNIKKESKNI